MHPVFSAGNLWVFCKDQDKIQGFFLSIFTLIEFFTLCMTTYWMLQRLLKKQQREQNDNTLLGALMPCSELVYRIIQMVFFYKYLQRAYRTTYE